MIGIITKIKRFYNNRKLWQKLLIMYLMVSFIPIAGLGVTAYSISAGTMEKQVSIRISEITRTASAQIEDKCALCSDCFDQIVYDVSFLQAFSSEEADVHKLRDIQEICDSLGASVRKETGANGVLAVLPGGEIIPDSLSEGFAGAVKSKLPGIDFTDNPLLCMTADQTFVYAFRNIIDPYTGKNLGMLALVFEASGFFDRFYLPDIQEYAFVIQDGDGKNIYIEARLDKKYGNIYPAAFDSSVRNEIRMMGRTFLYAPVSVSAPGWNLCLLIPRHILFEGFSDIITYSITAALIGVVFVSLFSVLISLSFSRRLNSISAEMNKIGTGKLEINLVEDSAEDEIGRLTNMFHQMTHKINTLIIDRYDNELKLHEAQIRMLQAQINPHFLYNCMDTINWRAILNDDAETSAFVMNLSDFYRTCLNKGDWRSSMEDELKNIRSYLALQQDMHNNSFDVEYEISEAVYQYEAVNLMLQPLVENAIQHGVEKTPDKQGLIRVTAEVTGTNGGKAVKVTIFNSGRPIGSVLTSEHLKDHPTKGYGLVNVTKRIRLSYGEGYGLKIYPVKNGTVCELVIPAVSKEGTP